MIKQPAEMDFSNKKFSMILYGSPGMGKTTLALSAPNPILADFDRGVSRVKSQHRKATIVCNSYDEVLTDIKDPIVQACETLIIDTGGSLVTFLQDWAIKQNPSVNAQKNGAISLKGFGAVKAEFSRFTSMLRDVMNKNVIYVFHSTEEHDKDGNPQQRLLCEGAARNLVWQPCDLGGFMQMIGNKRYITFTPSEEFFAKGCYGIEGRFEIPTLGPTDPNDFLTKLFEKARANIALESAAFAPEKERYEEVMDEVARILAGVNTAEDATKAASDIPALKHALTSKSEASALLKAKVDGLGLKWSAEKKAYVAKQEGK
jgi:hypothetical protein